MCAEDTEDVGRLLVIIHGSGSDAQTHSDERKYVAESERGVREWSGVEEDVVHEEEHSRLSFLARDLVEKTLLDQILPNKTQIVNKTSRVVTSDSRDLIG